jgi:hypothetical protein
LDLERSQRTTPFGGHQSNANGFPHSSPSSPYYSALFTLNTPKPSNPSKNTEGAQPKGKSWFDGIKNNYNKLKFLNLFAPLMAILPIQPAATISIVALAQSHIGNIYGT